MVCSNSKTFLDFQKLNITFSKSLLRLYKEKERDRERPSLFQFSPRKTEVLIAELYHGQESRKEMLVYKQPLQ